MLTRSGQRCPDEAAVEEKLRQVMAEIDGRVFVLQFTANIPSIRSVMAAKGDRIVLQDVFTKYTLEATGHKDLAAWYGFVWKPFDGSGERAYSRIAAKYVEKHQACGNGSIIKLPNAVVFIRATMANMLRKRISDGIDISKDVLMYSMWSGYKKERRMTELLSLFQPEQMIDIHTGGHADRQHIAELIERVKPKKIACVHSENTMEIAAVAGDVTVVHRVCIEM